MSAVNEQMYCIGPHVSMYAPQCASKSKCLSISFVPLQKAAHTQSFHPWEAFHCAARLAWQAANSNTFSHANLNRGRNNNYITVIK